MRRALPLAVALALTDTAGASPSATEPFAETVVELRVNAQAETTTLVVRRDADGTLLLRAADLAALRMRTPSRGAVSVHGERYYRLGPEIGAHVAFDEEAQSADVVLPANAFLATHSVVETPDAPRTISDGTGAFLNYDLSLQYAGDTASAGSLLELGAFGAHGVVTGSVVARQDDDAAELIRLDTSWTRDFPERLATLRLGDSITTPGAWGRSMRYGGIQFGTNFSTQPSLVTTPLLMASGEAVVPSTVDVFMNGRPVASETVPPGPFDIGQLPAVNGAGQMQVVVTDALGRQQVLVQSYYSGTSLLRRGLVEYSAELGAVRLDYASASNEYGDLVGAVTWRRGITDRFTGELHAEAQAAGTGALGLDAAWQVGTLGIVSATAAAGGDEAGYGYLGGFGLERSGPRLSLFLRTQWTSELFTTLGGAEPEDRPRRRSFGGLGLNFGRVGSLQLLYGLETRWHAPKVETLGLSYSLSLGALGFANLIVSHSATTEVPTDVLFTWTVPFGDRGSASTSLRHGPVAADDEAGFEAVASVQQNLPVGTGAGFLATASTSEDYRLGYAWQRRAGTATADYSRQGDEDGWRVGAIGGLAITGAGVMASRSLDQSFAIVQVADYEGIEVSVANQPVARTDRKGRVLLENLRPYEANQVSIDPTALPMDATLDTAKIEVTPAYRSGAMVRFPVTRADAVTLRLEQEDGGAVPAGATVTMQGQSFPVAMNGLVHLTGLSGRRTATATWRDGACVFDVERPPGSEPLPDLGTVTCRRRAAAGGGT